MVRSKTIKLNHVALGDVTVKIDTEDAYLFTNSHATIATFDTLGCNPKVRFTNMEGRPYAARAILAEHNALDNSKNVFFKNGDWTDLRKANLIQK